MLMMKSISKVRVIPSSIDTVSSRKVKAPLLDFSENYQMSLATQVGLNSQRLEPASYSHV